MTRAHATLLFGLLAASGVPLGAQRQTIASRDAVYHWVEAVITHVPGQPDAAVRAIAAMTYGARRELRTNEEAERLYRRTLDVDPSYVEARVRLARLLEHRGKHGEAAQEINKALEAQPAGVIGYYAHIVAGRIASSSSRYDEALRHYRAAASLFRHAQSALLGASHAALMLADVPQTLAPLQQLGVQGTASDSDPWWDYSLGAGRDAKELLAALWARVTKR